ncbi:MAG: dihydropteroate synthase [Candidatus Thermoplasmatota archaeon]
MNHNPHIKTVNSYSALKAEMEKIGASKDGIELMVPKGLHRIVKLENLRNREANIIKQELLACGGDAAISWKALSFGTKRSDALLLANLRQYSILIDKLRKQPFDLPRVSDEIKVLLENFALRKGEMKFRNGTLTFGKKTYIMGILNVTPDSFSNGSKYLSFDSAIRHAKEMVDYGADIIDIGGESTRPYSKKVSADEEWGRIGKVIEEIRKLDVIISVDTSKYEVAKRSLELGVDMINDISGLRGSRKIAEVIASYDVPVVIMHMLGNPRTMQDNPEYKDVVSDIINFLRKRIEYALKCGIRKENIIIDPGIGFGKKTEHNIEIIKRLEEFRSLGAPVLVGTSRKSFIGNVLGLEVNERLEGTIATCVASIILGADIVRVHDVKEVSRAVRMTDAIFR